MLRFGASPATPALLSNGAHSEWLNTFFEFGEYLHLNGEWRKHVLQIYKFTMRVSRRRHNNNSDRFNSPQQNDIQCECVKH